MARPPMIPSSVFARGLTGTQGDPGVDGVNAIPADDFIAARIADDASATSGAMDAKLAPDYAKRVTATMSPVLDWTGRRVLWLGTSIPHEGAGADSYPELATKALGATVVNNAWSGSHATYNPADSPTDLATIKALAMTEDDRQAGLTLHGPTSVYDDSFDLVTKASQMTADYRIGNQIASATPPSVVILDHNHNDRLEDAGTLDPLEVSITGITKGATTVVTLSDAAGFAVGDGIALRVVGIANLDHAAARIQAVAGNDVTINVNSSGYAGSLTSGSAIRLDRTTQYGAMEFLLHYIQWRAILAEITVTTIIASSPSEFTVDGTYQSSIYTNARNWQDLAGKWGIGFFDTAAHMGIDETTHPVYFPDLIHPTTASARAALAAHWVTWLSGGALNPRAAIPALTNDTYTDGQAAVYDRWSDAFSTPDVQVGEASSVFAEDFASIADWTSVATGSAPVVEAAPWGGGDQSAKFVATAQTSYIRRDPITTDEGFSCEFDVYLPTVAGLTATGVKTIGLAQFSPTGINQAWHIIQLVVTPAGTRIRSAYFTGLTGSGGVLVVPGAKTFWLQAATKHRVKLEVFRATADHPGGVILTVDGERLTFPTDTTDTIWTGTPGRFQLGIISSNVENSVTVYTGNLTVDKAPVRDFTDRYTGSFTVNGGANTATVVNGVITAVS